MMKIGFFGGSFDPLHFGHLNLAIRLLEKCLLDRVILCPVFQSPFKGSCPGASPEHRVKMLSLLTKEIPFFDLSTLEIQRGGISYTVDTVKSLKSQYASERKKVDLYLLLSSDALKSFHLWKSVEELLSLAKPLIGARNGFSLQEVPDTPLKKNLLQSVVQTPVMDISSTEIRERILKGLYCGHLVPSIVLDYIHTYRLYS